MDLSFRNARLEKTFNSAAALTKKYGQRMARTIQVRMATLKNAKSLSMIPVTRPERRHLLGGDRKGLFAVDLVQPQRLVFEPNHNPVPTLEDGGVDTEKVTAITVMEVVDYH